MVESFGSALREARRAAGVSQRELAERTGLDFSYISKVENGRVPPPAADTVVKFCAVLKVPTEGLLALAGKLPSEVQQTMGTSSQAQRFLAEAQLLRLSNEEWDMLTNSLRGLRDES